MSRHRSNPRDPGRREVLRRGAQSALAVGMLGSLALEGCRGSRSKRPSILLITLDTTRRDRLSCYGCERPTSLNLDQVAEQSVFYRNAIAPSNWTLPSHASLFTGKFTTSHGARFDPEGPLCLGGHLEGPQEFWDKFRARGLAPDEVTLASILREQGYATAGIGSGPWLKRAFGLDKGFEFYDDSNISTENGRRASEVTPAALRWLKEVGDREFFLFLNYFDPHYPYFPPEGFAYRFLPPGARNRDPNAQLTKSELLALYDSEILYMDHYIGVLLQGVQDLGLFDSTWIIVTSDHGELLGEHRRTGHGHRLYQQEIRIPLFMKYPYGEIAPRSVDQAVQLTDVMPVILDRLGIATPPGIQGGLPPDVGHPIVSEIYPLEFLSKDGSSRAIFEGGYKYVWNAKGDHALFDLSRDPGEQNNLLPEQPERAEAMQGRLDAYLASLPTPTTTGEEQVLDEETQRALRGLGYVE